jgi:hypothetical protein
MLWLATKTAARNLNRETGSIGGFVVAPLFIMLSVALGCAAVVTPMKPGADHSITPDEGLVLGRIQLTDSDAEAFSSPGQPFRTTFQIQWRLKERTLGKTFVINGLPTNGPFVVKLPTGSYQLTALSFDTAFGIWQASLPTSFTVSPQGCTYLGTWELRTRAGFFDGFIVRYVVDQHNIAESDLKTFVNNGLGNSMVIELGSSIASPLILTFRTQGTELTSPP